MTKYSVLIAGTIEPGYDMPVEDLERVVRNLLDDFVISPQIPPATRITIGTINVVVEP